jgi:hypothetical protein
MEKQLSFDIGDKVTICCFGYRTPGTVIDKTKSGKTITVRKHDWKWDEPINEGPMIKQIKLHTIEKEPTGEIHKFRFRDGTGGYFGQAFVQIGDTYCYLSDKKDWSDLSIDFGT